MVKAEVEMVNSVAKDEQEDDVDMKVHIFANAKKKKVTVPYTSVSGRFSSVEELIQKAGKFYPVKGAQQAFIKGDVASIFKAISQGGKVQANGTILMQDGTKLFTHFSTKTGVYTIDINRAGEVFKIRVTP